MSKPRFYITTAIDYPNGAPHMGHAYEKLVTDCYARWYRAMGYDTYYLTGTDENGQKLKKAAEAAGQETQAFVDEQVVSFRKLCKDLQISNDDFIRTTEQRHVRVAQEIWKKLESQEDIFSGHYEGLYCINCEAFYTELQAQEGSCPVHGQPLENVKEKGFFFRISKYADWIEKYIEDNKSFVAPASARKEILSRIKKDKVRDISVSRPNEGWGIPVPGHEDFVMYTWFDALINYLAGVIDKQETKEYWPAQVHVIGKDIVWFHCVIWPCMLKAAGYEIPEQVYVHGMVLGQDGRKMSKSLGNGVDPNEMIQKFPVESFRYYILRAIPSGQDGAFVVKDMIARHNSELANDFGNLLMRVVKLGMKRVGQEFTPDSITKDLDFTELGQKMSQAMDLREHHRALELLWEAINQTNLYLNDKEPWKLKDDLEAFKVVIYNALYALHCFGSLMHAFLPEISKKTLECLGTKNEGLGGLVFGSHHFKLKTPEALFPKIDFEENE